MRAFIFWIGVTSSSIFALGLCASYVNPILVEKLARIAIQHEVVKRVEQKLGSLEDSKIAATVHKAFKSDAERAMKFKELVQRKVDQELDKMKDPNCDCRIIDPKILEELPKIVPNIFDDAIIYLEKLINV